MRNLLASLFLLVAGTAAAQPIPGGGSYNAAIPIPLPTRVIGTRTGLATNYSSQNNHRWQQGIIHPLPYGAWTAQFVLPGWVQFHGVVSAYRGEQEIPPAVWYADKVTSITSGGSNYKVGDLIVMPVWGSGLAPAIIQVDSVSGGAVTQAHVVRGGVYSAPLADGTAQMALWQQGYGVGAYIETAGFSGSNPSSSLNVTANSGGYNYVAANTTVAIASGPSCTNSGATPTAVIDTQSGAITGITYTASNITCSTTNNNNMIFAISSGTGTLGSGAAFTVSWASAAYAARLSVEASPPNENCTFNLPVSCVYQTVTANMGPGNNGTDNLGIAQDIYVPAGGNIITQPVGVNVNPGGFIRLRAQLYGNVPTGRYTVMQGDTVTGLNYASYDYTQGGGAFNYSWPGSNPSVFQPLAIIGIPKISGPSLLFTGDSTISASTGLSDGIGVDAFDTVYGSNGPFERAAMGNGNSYPYVNFAESGDTLWSRNRTHAMRDGAQSLIAQYAKFPDLCMQENFGNDAASSGYGTFAQIQVEEITEVARLRALGCKVVGTVTMPPYTTAGSSTYNLGWAEISTAGSGYGANTTFTATVALNGGTCSTLPTVTVATDSGGVPRQVSSVSNIGSCTVQPGSPNTVTGGAGSGLQMTLYWSNLNTGQTPITPYSTVAGLRNAQLRTKSPQFGTYGQWNPSAGTGTYDFLMDWVGVTEQVPAGSGLWVVGCSVGAGETAPNCIIQESAVLAPLFATWGAIAEGR